MTQKHLELMERLKARLDSHYDKYVDEIMEMDKEQIFECAAEIIAARETHYEMCFWLEMSMRESALFIGLAGEPLSEQELIALLALENPLETLAGKWWLHTIGSKADFYEFFNDEFRQTL